MSVQDNPWQNTPLLFRPHYWVFGEAPFQSLEPFQKEQSINALILKRDKIILSDQTDLLNPIDVSISIHNILNDPRYEDRYEIISSNDSMPINGLSENKTSYFWSFVKSENQFALTLHWVLDDNHFDILNREPLENFTTTDLAQKLWEISGEKTPDTEKQEKQEMGNIFAQLKNIPNSPYRNLSNNEERAILQNASFIMASNPGVIIDHQIIDQAFNVFQTNKQTMAYTFNYLKSHYPHCGYSQLSHNEERALLEYASSIMATNPDIIKDSRVIDAAFKNFQTHKQTMENIFNYLKRNYPHCGYSQLSHDEECALLQYASYIMAANPDLIKDSRIIDAAYRDFQR